MFVFRTVPQKVQGGLILLLWIISAICRGAVCVLQPSPAAASASSVGNGVELGAQLLLLG